MNERFELQYETQHPRGQDKWSPYVSYKDHDEALRFLELCSVMHPDWRWRLVKFTETVDILEEREAKQFSEKS